MKNKTSETRGDILWTIITVLALAILTNVFFPFYRPFFKRLITFVRPTPAPTPAYIEVNPTLSSIEEATMSTRISDFYEPLINQNADAASNDPTKKTASKSAVKDTRPPTVTINGGPTEGSGVPPGTKICFPLWITDDISSYEQVSVRVRVDQGQWGPWEKSMEYCYETLPIGMHTFVIQGKDETGNVGPETRRGFEIK
jgi:hypothetical protein